MTHPLDRGQQRAEWTTSGGPGEAEVRTKNNLTDEMDGNLPVTE